MKYYLIALFIAVAISIYFAIRNERKFQRELEKLSTFRKEIEDVSIRLERLNNNNLHKTKSKILFRSSYELMDFEFITSDQHRNLSCIDIELDLLHCLQYNINKDKNLIMSKKSLVYKNGLEKDKVQSDDIYDFSNHSYA